MSLDDSLRRAARFVASWPAPVALIGGLAIVARVRARPTRDADFVLAVTDDGVQALLDHATAHGYSVPPDVDEWLEGGLLPLRDADGFAVDLLLADDEFLRGVARRAEPMELADLVFPVATLEDLVLLKLHAGRPIDIDDVLAIKDAHSEALDMAYLRVHAADLNVADRLDLYFSAAG